MNMTESKKRIFGQPSWSFRSDQVEVAVTERGGHMAPVSFYREDAHPVRPYYVNPWHAERLPTGLPLLDVLRGDFFCMPFGAANDYKGERHPVHGESANSAWSFVSLDREGPVTTLKLGLQTQARPGRVTKTLSLVGGHNVVYCGHLLEGLAGRMCLSHHATLDLPEEEGSLLLSSSPVRFGLVSPRAAELNNRNEYYFPRAGARFKSLARVPTVWKDPAYEDCSSLPRRYGYMGLLAFYVRPGTGPAWVVASIPSRRYLWFALKNPALLPQTVLWMSNGGRHASPWNGRNRCLGIEDGCAYFGEGLTMSARRNELNAEGIATALRLRADRPTAIHYIQGVVRTPRGFDRVRNVRFAPDGILLTARSGKSVTAPVRWQFVLDGRLSD
jgi:hypothetical protein